MNRFSVVIVVLCAATTVAHAEPLFRARTTIETFLYLPPDGYAPTVKISLQQPNAASYGLELSSEVRWRRLVAAVHPLILFGESSTASPTYNAVPKSMRLQYGGGLQLSPRVQLRVNHGEWYDLHHALETHAAIWDSASLHVDRGGDYRHDFVELHVFPPHGEYDPSPAVPFSERVVARYAIEMAITAPAARLRRPFVFAEPFFLFGNSRPQLAYNWSPQPLAVRLAYGAGYAITNRAQLRITRGEWRDLGGYKGTRQLWNGLSVRYGW